MKLKKYDSINVIPFIDVFIGTFSNSFINFNFITKGIIPHCFYLVTPEQEHYKYLN